MTYASTSARFGGRTSAAAAVSKPLPVFRGRKRNEWPASCKLVTDKFRSFVETQAHGQEMEVFQQMFAASRPKFIAMARAILRNREDAEDAVQNAFLSGYLHLRAFEGRSALKTWFTRIVLNAAFLIQRKRKSLRTDPQLEPSATDEANCAEGISTSQPDPEMVYAKKEILQRIDASLRRMTPALRQAFTMTYYDEMSSREACALLGIPAGTFKARLFRARRQLLKQARRTLAAPARGTNHSAFFPDNNAFQTICAGRSDRASLEASFS